MEKLKRWVYGFADLLFFGKGVPRTINGFLIRFPARWSRYFEKDYEKENVEFLKKTVRPGDVIVDIGAHLGLMSVICSQLAGKNGRVFSFEPSPDTFKVLRRVAGLNAGFAAMECIQQAVSEKEGEVSFFLSSDAGSNSNSLVEKHDLNRQAISITCTSLDNFVKERDIQKLALVKVDAEGSELQVLKGAEHTLRQLKPKIILAIHPRLIRNNGNEPVEVYRQITALGYKVEYRSGFLSESAFCSIEDFFDVHLLPSGQ